MNPKFDRAPKLEGGQPTKEKQLELTGEEMGFVSTYCEGVEKYINANQADFKKEGVIYVPLSAVQMPKGITLRSAVVEAIAQTLLHEGLIAVKEPYPENEGEEMLKITLYIKNQDNRP